MSDMLIEQFLSWQQARAEHRRKRKTGRKRKLGLRGSQWMGKWGVHQDKAASAWLYSLEMCFAADYDAHQLQGPTQMTSDGAIRDLQPQVSLHTMIPEHHLVRTSLALAPCQTALGTGSNKYSTVD